MARQDQNDFSLHMPCPHSIWKLGHVCIKNYIEMQTRGGVQVISNCVSIDWLFSITREGRNKTRLSLPHRSFDFISAVWQQDVLPRGASEGLPGSAGWENPFVQESCLLQALLNTELPNNWEWLTGLHSMVIDSELTLPALQHFLRVEISVIELLVHSCVPSCVPPKLRPLSQMTW